MLMTMAPLPSLDTIAAISTPPGRGGIGIVRLSGPDALAIAGNLVRLVSPLEHTRARFVRVLDNRAPDPEGAPALDEAVVTAFLSPNSYTGDDVVEIAAHGAPVILDAILTAALRHGARLAEPGEFTQRAFLSGRLDLTEAEAVHDLIAAQTLEQARAAAQQLGGSLSRRVAPVKGQLLHLIALLEAGMDFASGELDDVDVVAPMHIAQEIHAVHAALMDLSRSYRAGALLRSGASLALVGRPNAGKSSLFNRLLQRPRAIVTATAGTTRDTLEETWALNGIPIRLVDTAGLRWAGDAPVDEAERLGIERSRESLADADVVVLVHDASAPIAQEELELATSLGDRPHVLVGNKIDLLAKSKHHPQSTGANSSDHPGSNEANSSDHPGSNEANSSDYPESTEANSKHHPQSTEANNSDHPESTEVNSSTLMLPVSALTGQGLDELRTAILQQLNAGSGALESGALSNRRQYEAVLTAIAALEAAAEANTTSLPHEMLLVDLHNALRALDTLTGATTADDILARIFSTFCIGK